MSLNLTVELQGLDHLLKNVADVPARAMKSAGASMYREGSDVITDSKENYVPVKDGILRDSGHVELPRFEGNDVEVQLGFGGAAEDYAVVQHEREDFNHPNGGEAKYLEKPLLQRAAGMAERIAADVAHDLENIQ